ncbi:hypothetical protein [Actinokineospora terrae]|uniref:hypothetical protein n=1 Tax=Actinokineospora terrae TaxID=155974 RepID=UPI001160CDBB|nr:hypothetical protein [Actinokineospora terrae]
MDVDNLRRADEKSANGGELLAPASRRNHLLVTRKPTSTWRGHFARIDLDLDLLIVDEVDASAAR